MRFPGTILPCAAALLSALSAAAEPEASPLSNAPATTVSPAVAGRCDEALRHARRGEFEEARVLYARAFDADQSTPILFNLALAETQFPNRAVDALSHLREYLRRADAEPAKLALIQANLLPRALAATAHLRLVWTPSQAVLLGWATTPTFFLDGVPVHVDSDTLDLLPGPHVLIAKTEDGRWVAVMNAMAGETAVPDMQLAVVLSTSRGAR